MPADARRCLSVILRAGGLRQWGGRERLCRISDPHRV